MRWLADENFNNDIIRALLRRSAGIDIVRTQDVGLLGSEDDVVLEWAAKDGRILLTHDVATITVHAYRRIMEGHRMPGVLEMRRDIPISVALDDILLLDECSLDDEWEGQVRYLPLR